MNAWLPTTKKEVEARGWDSLDVILFSGDAYVDHPSFGAAVIGRTLEAEGLRVAIVPQPDWRGDFRDFRKLGIPRLFFGVSPGAMDSMINHYTANKRLRSDDAYTPDRRAGMRPDYPSIVYTGILRQLYPETPIVLGGIEASLRRLTHYDYWQDKLRPGILADSPADLLIYGMGELPLKELVRHIKLGEPFRTIRDIPQTAYITTDPITPLTDDIHLFSHEKCLVDKLKQAENFRHIEEESNKYHASRILQQVGKRTIVVNPPFPPMTEKQIDASFDLPYTRLPHPKYKGKTIPAFEMIKFSVNLHRGCFGGCAFCTISAHQGKFIASRSKDSILKEVHQITQMPDFKGYLSDLGGPSANMYHMKGTDEHICEKCKKPSCIFPAICPNLNADHSALLDIYREVDRLPEVKKSFVGSGIRYDLLLHKYKEESKNEAARTYMEELIAKHISGRLKVAPEHTSDAVLKQMRKPSFELFGQFKRIFEENNQRYKLNQQLIPYFISSHPGCHEADMADLAIQTKRLNFQLEQVQDFTPTPMTLATEIYYTGYHPYTLEKVYTAKSKDEKLAQRQFFFWYQPEYRQKIIRSLQRIDRKDLIDQLFGKQPVTGQRLRKNKRS
ncbi:MAG: YgiQ family radical SAM protein [Massilibacteroides sp.]|nr:YgiQ family radical SAM protein [Massilibacteroides sp.]MDD3062531.1 YgiQ family radical SAM protein [Massilibacteroides sp.]MDD4115361.1 YgiQ family radical SAM protein [Massilibacteroides sp.]MDD4659377.1 YgiQ family radical SAM protein [Massilibacteroides sp.]